MASEQDEPQAARDLPKDEKAKEPEQSKEDNQNHTAEEPFALDRKGAKVGVGDTVIIACRVGGVRGTTLSLVSNYGVKSEGGGTEHATFYAEAAVCEMTVDTNEG